MSASKLAELKVEALKFSQGVPRTSYKSIFKKVEDCFIGDEGISWLLKNLNLHDRQEALLIGQEMMDIGYIYEVSSNSNSYKDSNKSYYAFNNDVLIIQPQIQQKKSVRFSKRLTIQYDDDELISMTSTHNPSELEESVPTYVKKQLSPTSPAPLNLEEIKETEEDDDWGKLASPSTKTDYLVGHGTSLKHARSSTLKKRFSMTLSRPWSTTASLLHIEGLEDVITPAKRNTITNIEKGRVSTLITPEKHQKILDAMDNAFNDVILPEPWISDSESDKKDDEWSDEIFVESANDEKPAAITRKKSDFIGRHLASLTVYSADELSNYHNEYDGLRRDTVSYANHLTNLARNAVSNYDEEELFDDQGTKEKSVTKRKGTLTALTPEKEKEISRTAILNEIITTEETYVESLDMLINEFILYIFDDKNKIVSNKEKKYEKELLSNLKEIYDFQSKLYILLKKAKESNKLEEIPSILLKECDGLEKHSGYLIDYNKICDLWGQLQQKNKKIDLHIRKKRKEKKPLTSLLITPIQRIPRYLLLLGELLKHTDKKNNNYKIISDTYAKIHTIADDINEKQRQIENCTQSLQILNTIKNFSPNTELVNEERQFIKNYVFDWYKSDKVIKPRTLYAFNDIIIMVNEKMQFKYLFQMKTIAIKRTKTNPNQIELLSIENKKTLKFSVKEDDKKGLEELDELEELVRTCRVNELAKEMKDMDEGFKDKLVKSDSESAQYHKQVKEKKEKDELALKNFVQSNTKGKKDKVLNML